MCSSDSILIRTCNKWQPMRSETFQRKISCTKTRCESDYITPQYEGHYPFTPVCPKFNTNYHVNNTRSPLLIIIWCIFSFLFIGQEPNTWHANDCLQKMVCSCVVPSKCVLLQIIFYSCVIGTTFSREKWLIAFLSCQEVIKIWKQTWWSNGI